MSDVGSGHDIGCAAAARGGALLQLLQVLVMRNE
jgi:hypothetical protein